MFGCLGIFRRNLFEPVLPYPKKNEKRKNENGITEEDKRPTATGGFVSATPTQEFGWPWKWLWLQPWSCAMGTVMAKSMRQKSTRTLETNSKGTVKIGPKPPKMKYIFF